MGTLAEIGKSIGEALNSMGDYNARAAIQANNISAGAQAAQGIFNQESANAANWQNQQSVLNQYQYNSAQAALANQFSESMWQRTADWNEEMWEKQAAFNAEQAEIQRNWQERMANTQYQRAVGDMEKAGLNPILAVTGGGVGTGVPGGAAASVGGASMSSAQGAMASGGLLGANTASVGNYTGVMENVSTNLALLGALADGLSTATEASGGLGEVGEEIMTGVEGMLSNNVTLDPVGIGQKLGEATVDALKKAGTWIYNKVTGEKELHVNKKDYQRIVNNAEKNKQRGDVWNRFKNPVNG